VLGSGVLRRILGPDWEKVAGDWGILHDEDIHNLYSLQYVYRVFKSRQMRLAHHVAQWEK